MRYWVYSKNKVLGFLLLCILVLAAMGESSFAQPRPGEPNLHPEFPVREPTNLSPPIVAKPIHECALAVHVSGAVPHALIEVLANGNEPIGKESLWLGEGDVQITRALKVGDTISATQRVNGISSAPSIQPVPVTAFPAGALGIPVVGKDVWACGIVVPVGGLTPSTTVKVFEDGQPIGQGNTTGNWLPVQTQPLTGGRGVTAQQVACEADPARRIVGPMSTPPVPVGTAPNPPPAPGVDKPSVIPGKDTVVLTGLFTGAEAVVRDRGNTVSSGTYATGSDNWVPITPAASATSQIDAAQNLCARSAFSPTVDPTTNIRTPELVGPICDGQQFVVVRNTMQGANVVVFANGAIVGYGGGNGGEIVLGLGRKLRSNPQDHVTVRQSYGTLLSPGSNTVDVAGSIGTPSISVQGGESFFLAERDEEQIDAPVFPRGLGAGPTFKFQTCCGRRVNAQILGPDNAPVTDLVLDEVFPGYYSATWDWTSPRSGWSVPAGIPVGAYTVRITTECNQEPATARFYVIFNPAEVNGHPRFSFDETAVWFYSPENKTMPLSYALHPDDWRVFSKAIAEASGETSALAAATKISRMEAGLFTYSISKSDTDTLELISNGVAQCADDAAMLTSLLRSMGIPAHPVTADAGAETGSIPWGFDTWTEFLVPEAGGPQWKVVHSHWPQSGHIEGPMDRNPFGHSIGVATKSSNDIILMAGPGWVWTDLNSSSNPAITFGRQACGEPNQQLSSKAWIEELCEAGYWNNDTHWSCPAGGTGTRSLNITLGRGSSADHRRRAASGSITIRNDLGRPLSGRFQWRLAVDVPETKVFPDRVIQTTQVQISLAPRATRTIPFTFSLGDGLQPGETLHLQLVSGEQVLRSIEVPSLAYLAVESVGPKDLRLDVADAVVVTLSNRSRNLVRGIRVHVQGPSQVQLPLEIEGVRSILEPGEAITLRIPITGIAPLEAGALEVLVRSMDGGAIKHRISLRVQPEAQPQAPATLFRR